MGLESRGHQAGASVQGRPGCNPRAIQSWRLPGRGILSLSRVAAGSVPSLEAAAGLTGAWLYKVEESLSAV